MIDLANGRHPFRIPFHIALTLILLVLGIWSVLYTWPKRVVNYSRYTFTEKENRRLEKYSNAQFAYGINAWLDLQPTQALPFFHQAVTLNPLHFDAWLKLAEIEAELGNIVKAKSILSFTTRTTGQIYRWKWSQLVLADELGMHSIFYSHINDLLSKKKLIEDAFQLLHTQLGSDATAVIAVLDSAHLPIYLDWLMRWGLPEASAQVWESITAIDQPDKETALRYAHFLLDHKRTIASKEIWQQVTGDEDLTNPGFEQELSSQGFDWRHWKDKEKQWVMKRVSYQPQSGEYALKITFNGKTNLAFQHIYQIFAVSPQKRYKLSYFWKSRGVTTDQGPFIEVFGYDQKGLYQAGPMINGSRGWHEEYLVFETPEGCHAAVMRLRRRASMRFDSKSGGFYGSTASG